MHDGAPPHFSRVARQFLNQHFADKWIGRGGPIAWPARSPDLNPLDFHLWGHLKSIVYATSIENAETLRNRIEQRFRQIRETPGTTERVTRSMTRRVQACLQMPGGHFEHRRKFILSRKRRQTGHIFIFIFFSLFLDVQSAPEVGLTSYETPSILGLLWYR